MFRLLALLQLTRAALAFTAIADAWAVLLLRMPDQEPPESMGWTIVRMLIVSVISAGLYGFGMSLNDLLDARHDRLFAPRRPIPSGRIAPRTAIIVAVLLLMVSLMAAAAYTALGSLQGIVTGRGGKEWVPWPLVFTFATAILIVFYDATAKYLGAVGILTLGAIRSLHCLIGNPQTPLLFLSMFLLTHIFFVTLIAYRLENKRPRLRRWNLTVGVAGLVIGNGLAVWYMNLKGTFEHPFAMMLLGPSAAMAAFAVWGVFVLRATSITARQKGDRIMLMGLFWLFVYDASMLLSNGQWLAGLAVMGLFACALVSFFVLRMLGRMLSQPRVQYRIERPGT